MQDRHAAHRHAELVRQHPAGLAATINSSAVGITASVLTDASGSRLSLVSASSGAGGNITVSNNSIAALLNYTGTAATDTANASGTIGAVARESDSLSGSLSIQVGNGTTENVVIGATPSSPAANTLYIASGVNTLSGLAGAITAANIGVTASVVTNTDGTFGLQLVSGTAGSSGNLNVTSTLQDTETSGLAYTSAVTGKNANLTVDGVELTSASNTVANLIPGVTFQLLAPSATESDGSLEQVQVVIGNDNTGVESAMTQFVSDYNSLVSAVNTQEGNNSSGNPEPLFGSPTLSLLQQQLLGGLNTSNPNGTLTSIKDDEGTTLSGSISIQVGSGTARTIVVGAAPGSGAAANTYYTGAASGSNTLSGLASAINSSNIGVTATVVDTDGESTLALQSGTEGSTGALTVTSHIAASSATPLSYSGTSGSGSQNSSGTLTSIANASDTLSGSLSIQVGSGTTTASRFHRRTTHWRAWPTPSTIRLGSGLRLRWLLTAMGHRACRWCRERRERTVRCR